MYLLIFSKLLINELPATYTKLNTYFSFAACNEFLNGNVYYLLIDCLKSVKFSSCERYQHDRPASFNYLQMVFRS